MTTGSWSLGSTSTEFYAMKSWSGANSPKGQRTENAYTSTSRHQLQTKFQQKDAQGGIGQAFVYDAAIQHLDWSSNDELKLLSRLSDKIRGHDFNAGIFLAESHKAVAMITGAVENFALGFRAFKRGNFEGAVRAFGKVPSGAQQRAFHKLDKGDLASAWLAIQYGWRPLLNDVYAAGCALEKALGPPRVLTFRTSLTKQDDVNQSAGGSGTWLVHSGRKRKVQLIYRLSEQVGRARKLGLLDPFSVAWEVIPYSFVVDWFIPIGTFLAEASFFGGLSGAWTRSDWKQCQAYVKKFKSPDPGYTLVSKGSFTKRDTQFTRSTGVGNLAVPLPSPKSLGQALGLEHLANASALVLNAVNRMHRM